MIKKKKKKIKEASRQEQLKGAKELATSHLERPRLRWARLGHEKTVRPAPFGWTQSGCISLPVTVRVALLA